jgi:hypothetical protein
VVLVRLDSSGYLASLVEEGYWSVNLGNLRTDDLRDYLPVPPDAWIERRVLFGNGSSVVLPRDPDRRRRQVPENRDHPGHQRG